MMLIASVMDVVWVGLGAAFTLLLVVGLVFWIRQEWQSSSRQQSLFSCPDVLPQCH